jgi:hypothetical protein
MGLPEYLPKAVRVCSISVDKPLSILSNLWDSVVWQRKVEVAPLVYTTHRRQRPPSLPPEGRRKRTLGPLDPWTTENCAADY